MIEIDEKERADEYFNQACNLWREYGAIAKVQHISMHTNLEREESGLSIAFGNKTFSAKDMAISRMSLQLDLLSGIHMKSEIKMEASGATLHESLQENGKEKSKSRVVPIKSTSDLSVTNESKSVSASTSGRSSI